MPQVGLFLLVHVFSAVLPAVDPEENDYYDILGVRRSAENSKIRKAYKVKSLALHPDKIAQRGGTKEDAEEAAAKYEKVQEAYGVLVDDNKRQRYHALNCSPVRYQFVFGSSSLVNPAAMIENLAAASFIDKTRLVLAATFMLLFVWIQPILIASKINQSLGGSGTLEDTAWVVVLIPFWVFYSIYIGFWLAVLSIASSSKAKLSVIMCILENVCWFVGVLLLALAWDESVEPNYPQLFIPIYIAMILRWVQVSILLKKIRSDIGQMCTAEYLQEEILEGKPLDELSDDEREKILNENILVTVPDDFELDQDILPSAPSRDENGTPIERSVDHDKELRQSIESQKVEASPEYEAAIELYGASFYGLVFSVIFSSAFMVLLLLKLESVIDSSWWVIFIPWWVFLGGKFMYSISICICGSIQGDEIMLELHELQQKSGKNDQGGDVEKDSTPQTGDDGNLITSDEKNKDDDVSNDDFGSSCFVDPAESLRIPDLASIRAGKSNTEEKEEVSEPKPKETKTKSRGLDQNEGKKIDADDNDNDDESIHIDEETFRAWESAYAKAEESAMEQQAKSSLSCCTSCFQLIILCLIVAKLNASYQEDDGDAQEEDDDRDVGFDTFWILFPFMLIFGVIWCCCCCLVYTAGFSVTDEEESETGDEESPSGPEPTKQPEEQQVAVTSMPSQDIANEDNKKKQSTSRSSSSSPSLHVEVPNPEPEGDIEDID